MGDAGRKTAGAGEVIVTIRAGGPAHGRGGGEGVRIRDHLASVRTLLAWLRTGLVLLAMGFAVTKFQVLETRPGHSLGIVVAIIGWLVIAVAGVHYLRQRRAIEAAQVTPSVWWAVGLVGLTAAAGALILSYLAAFT